MFNLIRVRSNALMPFIIVEPNPTPDKPGNSPDLRSAVIKPGVSEVDADLFKAWSEAKPAPTLFANGAVTEMTEDEPEMSFGFEPALKAASTEGAAEGSLIKNAGPVSSADMKPTSTVPNDDSPRSQTNLPTGAPASAPATPAPTPAPAQAKKP